MKQEDYFKIMDSASEQDITEMMQYHRSRHIPAQREEIIMTQMNHTDNSTETQTGKKEIRMNRSKAMTASAVAALLLAANVGGGYLLLHGRNQDGLDSNAAYSMEDGSSDITSDIVEEISTDAAEVAPVAELPHYAQLMKDYYEYGTDEPCDFDFTGFGVDLNETFETDDYKITVRGAVGCDWVLYYFYDVEAKTDQSYSQYIGSMPEIVFLPDAGADIGFSYMVSPTEFYGGETELWHYYGTVTNTTDKPFFHENGESVPHTFTISAEYWTDHDFVKQPIADVTIDLNTPEYPLHALQDTVNICDLVSKPDAFTDVWTGFGRSQIFEMTQCAETPFGIYYVGAEYDTSALPKPDGNNPLGVQAGSGLSGNRADVTNPDGEITDTLYTGYNSFYGFREEEGRGGGFLNLLFERPYNAEKGSVQMLFGAQDPDDIPEQKKRGYYAEARQYEITDTVRLCSAGNQWTEPDTEALDRIYSDSEEDQMLKDAVLQAAKRYLENISLTQGDTLLTGDGDTLTSLDDLYLFAKTINEEIGIPHAEIMVSAYLNNEEVPLTDAAEQPYAFPLSPDDKMDMLAEIQPEIDDFSALKDAKLEIRVTCLPHVVRNTIGFTRSFVVILNPTDA